MKEDHISPQSWVGDVNLHNISIVTSWNLGHQMVKSEFPLASAGIAEALLQLEKEGNDLTFPFGQHAEDGPQDSDNEEEREEMENLVSPEHLSAQAAAEVISTTLLGEGDSPLLDLEDHAAIETSCKGQGEFNPLVDIGNVKMVSKPRVLQEQCFPRFLAQWIVSATAQGWPATQRPPFLTQLFLILHPKNF